MRGWCTRRALIVTALMLLVPCTTTAAERSAKSDHGTTVTATVGSDAKVNINTAGVKELTSLAGVTPKLAERIVEFRETHGPFKKPEDLRKVHGIGQAMFERNRERVVTK
jgi:competence protein ComEA